MQATAEILKALVPIAWFGLAAVVIWRLFPAFEQILRSRSFTVKIAGQELSVQETTEQISSQLKDLQNQVLELRQTAGTSLSRSGRLSAAAKREAPAVSLERIADARRLSVLWVDDTPENNALEIAQLKERGIDLLLARTTAEALLLLARHCDIRAIISDMLRSEGGNLHPRAGLELLKAARDQGFGQPFLVYSNPGTAPRYVNDVLGAGGDGATGSPVELLEWIEKQLA
jgi:CheY-like chemotaxis protein